MNNYKKLSITDVYPKVESYDQLSLIKNYIFWVVNISSGNKKKSAIFVRPFFQKNKEAQNLTGDSFYIKSNFHGYGGKSYKGFLHNDKFYLIWIDQITSSLWFNIFEINTKKANNANYLINLTSSKQLTKPVKCNFDSSFVLSKKDKLFGLYEKDDKDFLFSIDINQERQDLTVLREFEGFASSLVCNEDKTLLSWLEWNRNNMPWENNNLFFGSVDTFGHLQKIVKFKNKNINSHKSVSFFQPLWISKNILVCAEDSSGWWNLLFLKINQIEEIHILKKIQKEFYEYGLPEWISGMSIFAGSRNNLFCLANNRQSWIIEHYQDCSFHQKIDLPYNCIRELHVSSNKLICLASNNISHEKLIEIDIDNFPKSLYVSKTVKSEIINSASKAESYWFKGYGNKLTHAWIYKPNSSKKDKFPLIVKAHSGPTSSFDGSFNLEVQYWTSRGWIVAEVNYGGSSGFGREYRERLNNLWGIVDSADCIALAQSLEAEQLIDPSRIVISGNSAGGFTALTALYENNLFKAALCKYPVIDLNSMRLNTHRFERNYLNSLIGNFSNNQKEYLERSPNNNLHKLNKPTLIFHGKKDLVINFSESIDFVKKLSEKNVYSEIVLFDEEGHGFKKIQSKIMVLEKTEKFLKHVFTSKN